MAVGTVLSLHRWPVKSMAGERVTALCLDARGAAGDRTHALLHSPAGTAARLTAREAPRMLAWAARYPGVHDGALDPAAPPLPVLTAPDGRTWSWGDPALADVLEQDLGRPVVLRRDVAGQQDLGDSLLITVEATLRASERALGTPLDLRRFRPNVHVLLDAEPFAEEQWEGRRLRVGDAELQLLHPCERCVIPTRDPDTQAKWPGLARWLVREHANRFGINARPLGPAIIRAGDAVVLV